MKIELDEMDVDFLSKHHSQETWRRHYEEALVRCAEYSIEIEQLRDALKKYGQHLSDCSLALGGYQCTCGFNQQEQPR